MINLKTLSLSFFLSVLFINCSLAQEKTLPPPPPAMNVKANKFESIGGNFSINITQAPSQTRDLGTETANKKGVDVGKIFIWQFPEKALYTFMYKNAFDSDGNPLEQNGDSKSQNLRDFESLKIGMRRGIANNNAKLLSEKSISFRSYLKNT